MTSPSDSLAVSAIFNKTVYFIENFIELKWIYDFAHSRTREKSIDVSGCPPDSTTKTMVKANKSKMYNICNTVRIVEERLAIAQLESSRSVLR